MKKIKSVFALFVLWSFVLLSCSSDDAEKPSVKADFEFDVAEATVTFTSTSEGATAYAWDFGDEGVSTEESPVYEYSELATFDVTLTVTGDGGSTDEVTKQITIETLPIALKFNPTWPAANGYSGTTVTLSEEDKEYLEDNLGMTAAEITESLVASDGDVAFKAVVGSTLSDSEPTANGYGFWYAADGSVTSWGADARTYLEFNPETYSIALGHYPGQAVAGDKFTIKYALVTADAQVTFVFKITIGE
jgi:PKD repeat protein